MLGLKVIRFLGGGFWHKAMFLQPNELENSCLSPRKRTFKKKAPSTWEEKKEDEVEHQIFARNHLLRK